MPSRSLLFVFVACIAASCGGAKHVDESGAYTVQVGASAARAAAAVHVDLRKLVALGADRAFARLPHRGRLTIYVADSPQGAIPGIGVGGYTGPNGDVYVSLNPKEAGFGKKLAEWIPKTIAHELHHSSRIRTGPGYGTSLADGLVAEGLADRFSDSLFPTPRGPWDHALTAVQERRAWKAARPILYEPFGYDHTSWFFGGHGLPPWTGYSLGYTVVEAYLKAHPGATAVDVPARRVLAAFAGFPTATATAP